MVGIEDDSEGGKVVDPSQLPVRLLDTGQNKWKSGSQPFDIPADATRFRLEFTCFVGDKSDHLDVDLSAYLFDAKGSYVEAVCYGCPASTDGGIVHTHDTVQPEAGKIVEEMDFDLSVVHKRIFSVCFLATTYGEHNFKSLRSIQIRFLAPSHLLSDSLEREISRIVYTPEGCVGLNKGRCNNSANCRWTDDHNAIVLGDIRRLLSQTTAAGGDTYLHSRKGSREAGAWNLRAPNVIASYIDSSQEAIPLIQCYLREWIPSIEVIGQELLVRRVYDIVSFLPPADLEVLRSFWAKEGTNGVTKELFLGSMLRVLLRAHATLRDERQRLELTSLLSDLFDQISGNKSGGAAASTGFGTENYKLAWEQFTTFWVEAATINTHSQAVRCWADETLQWDIDPSFELSIRRPTKLISLPQMHVVVGLEERGSYVSILNGATGRVHVTLCPSSLQTVTTGGLNPHESFLTVLDVECVDTKGIVVISSTDHAISVWHYNHGYENAVWRCSMHSRSAQILVRWVAHERGFLISAGVDHVLTAWCIDKQLRLAVMQGHRARVTGVTYIPQHGQFATCAFDKTVRLWDADNFKPVAEMKRRSPVKLVESSGDFVLCITLELEAHVLSVSTKRLWCRLIGHNNHIVGAVIVYFVDARQGRQTRTITGDKMGEFFIWDIGNAQAKNGCADVLQTFSMYTWRPGFGEISGFERFHRHISAAGKTTSEDFGAMSGRKSDNSMSHVWPDIIVRGVGGTTVVRTRQLVKDARAANVLVYNDKSMDLIASTGEHLRFWNLQTSDPLRMIASPCPLGVTAMTTDRPDPRRIFLGTSDGGIAVVHIITGQLLFEVKGAHNGAVVLVVVSSATRDVISIGIDRRVVIHHEKTNGLSLVLTGSIEETHAAAITACAVSEEAQLIATAAGGEIRLWNKQDLSFQGGISDLEADILGLVFLPGTACLLASDSGGDVVLWVADVDKAGPAATATAAAAASTRGAVARTTMARCADRKTTAGGTSSVVEGETEEAGTKLDIQSDGSANSGRFSPACEGGLEMASGSHPEELTRVRGTVKSDPDGRRSGRRDDGRKGVRRSSESAGEGNEKVGKKFFMTNASPNEAPTSVQEKNGKLMGDTTEAAVAYPDAQTSTQQPNVSVTARQAVPCILRPGVLLSTRRALQGQKGPTNNYEQEVQKQQQHHQHHASPVYEIHLHNIYDDHKIGGSSFQKESSTGNDTASCDKEKRGITTGGDSAAYERGGRRASLVMTKRSSRRLSRGNSELSEENIDHDERRMKTLIITGSSSGWVAVWEVEGLMAAAGVDEDAMAAKLLRKQPMDKQGMHVRTTRHHRSGLNCFPPTASSVPIGGGGSTTVKGVLESLQPIAPSLKWEAHRGTPVSTLCALDKTPLLATASTDSTVRLFTLTDIQVGAQPFKATENLGEIDMRDTESVRIDRAEMWSCPSLTAANVRPAAEVEAYLAFSRNICTEIEEQTTQGTPPHSASAFPSSPPHDKLRTPNGLAGGELNNHFLDGARGVAADLKKGIAANLGGSIDPVSRALPDQGQPTTVANGRATGHLSSAMHRCDDDGQGSGSAGNGSTFLTDVRRPERGIVVDWVNKSQHKSNTSGKEEINPSDFAAPRAGRGIAEGNTINTRGDHGTAVGGWGEKAARGVLPGVFDGIARECTVNGNSTVDLEAAEGIPGGSIPLWDRGQCQPGSRDKRATPKSPCAAKNHLGKVIYENMYSEIKAGSACNALVTEYILQKKKRGDVVIDTEESPFLREHLHDKLPSLEERRTRRRDRATAARSVAPAPTAAPTHGEQSTIRSASSLEQDVAKMADVDAAAPAVDSVPTFSDGDDGSHGTVGANSAERKYNTEECRAARSERSNATHNANSGDSRRTTRRRRTPSGKEPINSELSSIDSGGIAHNSFGSRIRGKHEEATGQVKSGKRRREVMTSASLKTLSLREMKEQEECSGERGHGGDILDGLLYLIRPESGHRLVTRERTLSKSMSLPSADLQERWKQMMERFDDTVSPSPLDGHPAKLADRSKTKSTIGAYIRQKSEKANGLLAPRLEETDEALLSVANFGTYGRGEVEALGSVFLQFAREGYCFTYDMWRNAMLSNSGVKVLKGLQFGMLDEDNDGEVSLADITKAVFRRANDRDLPRIRRFLELWLNRERQLYQRRQVKKALQATRIAALGRASNAAHAETNPTDKEEIASPA